MHSVSPKVFLIQKPQIQYLEVQDWLTHIGVKTSVEDLLPSNTYEPASDGEALIFLGGKRCYMSFEVEGNKNLSRVRQDLTDFIDNILKVGHGSVVAHAHYTFVIEGCSRVCTAELNRHRVGANNDEMSDPPDISEGSQRFIRFGEDIPYTMPNCLKPEESSSNFSTVLESKKCQTKLVFDRAFSQDEENYRELEEIWKDELDPKSSFHGKKAITSMMRRIVGMGVASGGLWTYSLRALRNVFTQRCAPDAEEEILDVGNQMLELMRVTEPRLFADFEKDDKGYYRPKYHKV